MKGIVYLVGGGPGDVELLTMKAFRLIHECDVVVYDRLISKEIMDLIPKETKKINVGKTVDHHPVPQERINEILVEEAQKGQKVLRLKGGDPFVFGRGGEELEVLVERGVAFEVVPGITSSLAAPMYGGIPVTHRDYASSFHVITGHAKKGSEISIDFDALVRLKGTLIFMMSVGNVGLIAQGLQKAGMSPKMPCGVVENGTRLNQRTLFSNLENLEEEMAKKNIQSPAVILVGEVCGLEDSLSWFDRLPLKGVQGMVVQPKKKISTLATGLRNLGGDVELFPCVETNKKRPIEPPYEDFDILVFTSGEGVESFCSWLIEEGKDMRQLAGKKLVAIGPGTGRVLNKYGLSWDFVPSVYTGETLAKELLEQEWFHKDMKILLLRTNLGSKDIVEVLQEAGASYLDYPVYETKIIQKSPSISLEKMEWVAFTSKSSVEGFASSFEEKEYKDKIALCIGEKTAEGAQKLGMEVVISEECTIDSMIEKALEISRREKK